MQLSSSHREHGAFAKRNAFERTAVQQEPDHDDGGEQGADEAGAKLLDEEERGNDGDGDAHDLGCARGRHLVTKAVRSKDSSADQDHQATCFQSLLLSWAAL